MPIVEEALGCDAPTSYLRLRVSHTGRAWSAWLRRLHAFGEIASRDDIEAACDMACITFDAYTRRLSESGALLEQPA